MKKLIVIISLYLLIAAGCTTSEKENKPNSAVIQDNTVLEFYYRESNHIFFDQIVNEYEQRYPTIKINHYPIDNTLYFEKVTSSLESNEEVDVFDSGNITEYAYYVDNAYIYPIDDLLKRDHVNVVPYGPIFDEITMDGKIYGLPFITSSWVLFYNKDIFDELGVEYPNSKMTWDEFRELAGKVTFETSDKKIYGAYLHTWPQCWYGLALQTGASMIDIDLEPFEDALQYRIDLQKDGFIMPYSYAVDNNKHYKDVFVNEEAAMIPIGEWMIEQLRTAEKDGTLNFDWDIVPMPHPENVEPNITWGMSAQLMINKETIHLEEVWDFVKFASGQEGAKIFARNGRLPAYQTDDIKDIFTGQGGKPQNIDIIFDQKVYMEMPAVGKSYLFNDIFDEESEKALRNESTVEEAIQTIEKRIKEDY
ncbi:ABC transporter substrate-binding protein [Vallitalea okinawensis]|uniref:ABC transporter substrate-binding protein n=1 Tax=Vallitalea okinawensis TaxID=2078660 RepID=UPI000CFB371C|nr:sugar ABC transporter substrate-binding protein [Vallitalea okinawensis]